MKTIVSCVILILLANSCATIFNSRTQVIDVYTNKPVKIAIKNDTVPYLINHHNFAIARSKEPICLSLFNDSIEKNIFVNSELSPVLILNLFSPAFSGFLIDWTNQKRFTYPRTIYVDMNNLNNDYLKYVPWEYTPYSRKNILKITPLKTINFVNPGLELGFEWLNSQKFSSQFSATYIFPMSVWDIKEKFIPDMKGFALSLEEKYYLNRHAPNGIYLGLEFGYLNNKYNAIYDFEDSNTPDSLYYIAGYSDSIFIKKQTYSLNLKLGYQQIIKRLSFEIFLGLGVRYKDVRHFDRIKPEDVFASPIEPNIYYIADMEGKYWTISIPINFKIGWTF